MQAPAPKDCRRSAPTSASGTVGPKLRAMFLPGTRMASRMPTRPAPSPARSPAPGFGSSSLSPQVRCCEQRAGNRSLQAVRGIAVRWRVSAQKWSQCCQAAADSIRNGAPYSRDLLDNPRSVGGSWPSGVSGPDASTTEPSGATGALPKLVIEVNTRPPTAALRVYATTSSPVSTCLAVVSRVAVSDTANRQCGRYSASIGSRSACSTSTA